MRNLFVLGCVIFQRLSNAAVSSQPGEASNEIIWCLRSWLLRVSQIRSFHFHGINSPETGFFGIRATSVAADSTARKYWPITRGGSAAVCS